MVVPSAAVQVMREHRERLERLSERRALVPLRKLYEQAQAELERKLAAAGRMVRADTMTVYQQKLLLAQVKEAQIRLARAMGEELIDASADAQTEALRGLARDLVKLEKRFKGADITLPIEQAVRFRG